MVMIRDTIDPTRERDVAAAEALDLERQGLLLEGTRAKTDDGLRAAAVRQVQQQRADAAAVASPVQADADDTDPPGDDPGSNDPDDTDDTLES